MAQLFLSLVGSYHRLDEPWPHKIDPWKGVRLWNTAEQGTGTVVTFINSPNIWPTLRGIQVTRNNGQSSLATGHRSNCPKSSISINQKDRQAYIDHEGYSQLEQNATILNLSGKRTKYKRRISISLPGLKSSVVIDKGSQQATRYISILSRYSFVVRCSGTMPY